RWRGWLLPPPRWRPSAVSGCSSPASRPTVSGWSWTGRGASTGSARRRGWPGPAVGWARRPGLPGAGPPAPPPRPPPRPPRSTATALTTTRLLRIDRTELYDLLDEDGELARALLTGLARALRSLGAGLVDAL